MNRALRFIAPTVISDRVLCSHIADRYQESSRGTLTREMPDETGPPFPILKNVLLTIGSEISGNDLGYLLHKNPARIHTVELPFGSAHVFYPELGEQRSQAALLL